MKKYLFVFIVALGVFSSAFAQRCSTKKDDFTGKLTKVSMVSLTGFTNLSLPFVAMSNVNGDYSFGFVLNTTLGADNFDVEKMLCMIKFTDGTIKKFHSSKNSVVSTNAGGLMVAFYSDVNLEDLNFFKTHPVDMIRFSYKGSEDLGYDSKISTSKANQIMKGVDCVL